jgi:hypothetical protein
MIFYILFSPTNSKIITPNVPAVYEVGGGIQGLCEAKAAAANLPQ